MKHIAAYCFFVVGLITLLVGVYQVYPPAAVVVAGFLFCAVGINLAKDAGKL